MANESEKHPRAERFHWFTGESLESLAWQLREYIEGFGADHVRLEVRQHGDDMTLRVLSDTGEGDDPINESRLCPPICP